MQSTTPAFEDSIGTSPWTVLPRGTYRSPDGTTAHCAETKLGVDSNADMLYFLSRGPLARGSIEFLCEEQGEQGEATVSVRFFHSKPEILQHVRVCRLRRDDTNQGVGIHVSAFCFMSTRVQLADVDADADVLAGRMALPVTPGADGDRRGVAGLGGDPDDPATQVGTGAKGGEEVEVVVRHDRRRQAVRDAGGGITPGRSR